VPLIRPRSVLKPKPRFWGKPNQNRKLGFDRSPSRFWSCTRLTDGVAHSLNDAVIKLFLTGLLNDSQCDVGGRSGARVKVHCRRLSERANKPLYNGRPSSHTMLCRAGRRSTKHCMTMFFHVKQRCHPWPHVANRHISINQLLLSLWHHSHYDVIGATPTVTDIRTYVSTNVTYEWRNEHTDTLPRLIYRDLRSDGPRDTWPILTAV